MDIKKCSVCKVEKPLTDYHWNSKKHKYKRSYCKDCGKKARREWRNSLKDGLWTVYLLPDYNYVGITTCLHERMKRHEVQGRNTSNYKIIGKYKTGPQAAIVEAVYHNNGYEGFNYNQR